VGRGPVTHHTVAASPIDRTRARIDHQTRSYLERKHAEGKTNREALRCLKRHLARRVHRLLSTPPNNSNHTTAINLNTAISVPCLT
jgi:transposase